MPKVHKQGKEDIKVKLNIHIPIDMFFTREWAF